MSRLGALAFFFASTRILGQIPSYYLGMAFGRPLTVAYIGYYYFFRAHQLTPSLRIAMLFIIMAGTIVNMMIVVQAGLWLPTYPPASMFVFTPLT